jgi:hypothetical protein
MERAIRLARWFGHEALRVQDLLASRDDGNLDAIERKIADAGGEITVRGLMRRQHRGTAASARAQLDALERAGRGHWAESDDGEREVFRLGPAPAQATPAPTAAPERQPVSASEEPPPLERAAPDRVCQRVSDYIDKNSNASENGS